MRERERQRERERETERDMDSCRWVAYVHTDRVAQLPINKNLLRFGDVVVVHEPQETSFL